MKYEDFREELTAVINTLEYTELPKDLTYAEYKDLKAMLFKIEMLAMDRGFEVGECKGDCLFEMMAGILNPEVRNEIQS